MTTKNTKNKMRIHREDTVEVIAGNDRGARGRVLRALPKERRVIVEGINIRKKHQSAAQAGRSQIQPGIIQFEAAFDVSNVMLVCPNCNEASRVGMRRDEGKPIRVCKNCGEDID